MFTSFGHTEVIVTGISEQFSRDPAFGKVKGLQYLIESFSAPRLDRHRQCWLVEPKFAFDRTIHDSTKAYE